MVGTGVVEAELVDAASLWLERRDGVGGVLSGLETVLLDRGTPFWGQPGLCHAIGGDGVMDIVIEIANPILKRKLQLGGLAQGSLVELVLRGQLLDGTPIEACDFAVIDTSAH
jgi:hypothetical protein